MLLAVACYATGQGQIISSLTCSSTSVQNQQWWGFVTYPWLHDIARENVFFAIEMLMLFWFGRSVEQSLGRKSFLALYAALIIVPALVLEGLFLLTGQPFQLFGASTIHFSLFVGFSILEPEALIFFSFPAKWMAIVLVAISALAAISTRDWTGLIQLAVCIGVIWLAIKIHLQGWSWPTFSLPKLNQASTPNDMSVDEILDKISKKGLHSLTSRERSILENARKDLLRKDPRK
jgi:membrane associated rhomboid family serine protease